MSVKAMYRLPSMDTPPLQQFALKDNGFLQKLRKSIWENIE